MTRDELIEDLKKTGDGSMNVQIQMASGDLVNITDVGYSGIARSVVVYASDEDEDDE